MGGIGRARTLMIQMQRAAENIEVDGQIWIPDERLLLWLARNWTPWAFVRAILSVGFDLRSRPARVAMFEGPGAFSLGQTRWGRRLRAWLANRDVMVVVGDGLG